MVFNGCMLHRGECADQPGVLNLLNPWQYVHNECTVVCGHLVHHRSSVEAAPWLNYAWSAAVASCLLVITACMMGGALHNTAVTLEATCCIMQHVTSSVQLCRDIIFCNMMLSLRGH
jgi:hypothetical protein